MERGIKNMVFLVVNFFEYLDKKAFRIFGQKL